MSFGGLILTNDGRNEIAKAELGQMYSITDVIFGDGIYNGSYNAITALVNPVMTIPITKVERKESEVWLEIEFCSKDVPKAFYLREVGIKANGMLCYYDNAGTDAEYIDPNAANLVKQKRMRFILSISQECQVNVSVSSTLYALEDDLLAHTNDKLTHITPEERTTWNAKQNHITGAASSIADSNLTAYKALISNSEGKVSASAVSSDEIDNLSGSTGNIQKQLGDVRSYAKEYADSTYQQATGYADKVAADLIGGAPETLNTINKIADAVKDNKDVVTALNDAIGKKTNQKEFETHENNEYIHVNADKQAKWDGYEQEIADINSNLSVIGELYQFTLGGSKKGFVKGENKLTVHTELPAGRYLFTLNGVHESNAGEYGIYDVVFNPDDKNTRIYNGGIGTSLMSLSCAHDVSANCDINLLLYATNKYTTHSTWDVQAIRIR